MAEWTGESAETKAFLNEKEREAEEKLSDAVAELAQDAEVKWFEESELPLLLAYALKVLFLRILLSIPPCSAQKPFC